MARAGPGAVAECAASRQMRTDAEQRVEIGGQLGQANRPVDEFFGNDVRYGLPARQRLNGRAEPLPGSPVIEYFSLQ